MAARPPCEAMVRRVSGESFAEADGDLHRAALRAQSLAFKMKLEASRSAGAAALRNKAAELEASFAAEMEKTVASVRGNSGQELKVHSRATPPLPCAALSLRVPPCAVCRAWCRAGAFCAPRLCVLRAYSPRKARRPSCPPAHTPSTTRLFSLLSC